MKFDLEMQKIAGPTLRAVLIGASACVGNPAERASRLALHPKESGASTRKGRRGFIVEKSTIMTRFEVQTDQHSQKID
jgi:hypothetical protein